MFLKSDVCQHFAALKTCKRHQFCVFLIQIIIFWVQTEGLQVLGWVVSKSWQTSPPGKMLANKTPLKSWGLDGHDRTDGQRMDDDDGRTMGRTDGQRRTTNGQTDDIYTPPRFAIFVFFGNLQVFEKIF